MITLSRGNEEEEEEEEACWSPRVPGGLSIPLVLWVASSLRVSVDLKYGGCCRGGLSEMLHLNLVADSPASSGSCLLAPCWNATLADFLLMSVAIEVVSASPASLLDKWGSRSCRPRSGSPVAEAPLLQLASSSCCSCSVALRLFALTASFQALLTFVVPSVRRLLQVSVVSSITVSVVVVVRRFVG